MAETNNKINESKPPSMFRVHKT